MTIYYWFPFCFAQCFKVCWANPTCVMVLV